MDLIRKNHLEEGENKDMKSKSGGLTFSGLLTVAFVVLKLCGIINWSWWWVLSPFWIPLGLAIILLLISVILKLIYKSKN